MDPDRQISRYPEINAHSDSISIYQIALGHYLVLSGLREEALPQWHPQHAGRRAVLANGRELAMCEGLAGLRGQARSVAGAILSLLTLCPK